MELLRADPPLAGGAGGTEGLLALVILDLIPIMVIRPFLAGRSTHKGLMMFSYIFGGLLFGWYGIFLGPLLLIATIHLIRVGLPELANGDPVSAEVSTAHGLGAMPRSDQESSAEAGTDTDDGTVDE